MSKSDATKLRIAYNSRLQTTCFGGIALVGGGLGGVIFSGGEHPYFWYMITAGVVALTVLFMLAWQYDKEIERLTFNLEDM